MYSTILIISVIIILLFIIFKKPIKKFAFAKEDSEIDDKKLLEEYMKKKYRRIIENEEKLLKNYQMNNLVVNSKIVGFQKPIGKWTRMVMNTQLEYLSNVKRMLGDQFNKIGIWQMRVKAQAQFKGLGRSMGVGGGSKKSGRSK